MIKYPKQIDSVLRPDKTLGIDFQLSTPTENEYNNDKKMPLEMHSGFSRFVLTILEKGNAARANIPAEDADYILEKTNAAIKEIMKYKMNSNESDQLSPAYTQKLFGKNFENKTPAEILKDPSRKAELLKQRDFLKANMEKYKANRLQVEAIDDAIKLLEAGKLDGSINAKSTTIEIYTEDIKIPNISKVNEDGNTFVYNLSIVCNLDKIYPFTITIMNCYAPPIKGTGKIGVEMSKAKDQLKHSIMLSEKEFFRIAKKMEKSLDNFEALNFEKQLKLAKENSYFK